MTTPDSVQRKSCNFEFGKVRVRFDLRKGIILRSNHFAQGVLNGLLDAFHDFLVLSFGHLVGNASIIIELGRKKLASRMPIPFMKTPPSFDRSIA